MKTICDNGTNQCYLPEVTEFGCKIIANSQFQYDLEIIGPLELEQIEKGIRQANIDIRKFPYA
ncbi:MAG TPA: hypothetical protein DD473_14070 [Planctomycetaceae bacterium]|nr:hypothetical protein [Planctomycetaceae bacterium]